MKQIIFGALIVLLFATVVVGQNRIACTANIAITTVETDTTLTTFWETATIQVDGCDALVKLYFSSVDTLLSEDFFLIKQHQPISVQRDKNLGIPGLKRLKIKAVSGTGTAYLVGTQRR